MFLPLDLISALAVGGSVLFVGGALSLLPARRGGSPHLLVLDAAYSLSQVRQRKAVHTITSRDLNGFFSHVWSVHPLVGADPDRHGTSVGGLEITEVAERHTVIEAKIGRTPRLTLFPFLNLALSQGGLYLLLVRLIRRHGIDVIRAGDPYYLGLFGWLLSRTCRIPLVIRVNGNYDAIYESTGRSAYPRLFRRRSMEKKVERFIFLRAQLIAGANQNYLDYALANGAVLQRSALFPYGSLIDPVHFQAPEDRSRPDDLADQRWITCVGRLESVKHVADLVPMLDRVRVRHPEVHLLIIGTGAQEKELREEVRHSGQQDAVHFAGERSQPWIASALALSTVIVAPMAGRALVEAGLSGRPIVAYDVDWHSELITDGKTGLLVPFRDIEAMATSVVRLLDDRPFSDSLGMACRTRAMVAMDPRRLAAQEAEGYRSVLSRELLR